MVISKGINKAHLEELIMLHELLFDHDELSAHYDFEQMINLNQSYIMIDEISNEVVSFVGISDKLIFNEKQSYKVGLIGCIMTKPNYQRNGYAKQLLKQAIDDYLKTYDSVIIQAWNWDIYKSFDLIDTTTKYTYIYNDKFNKTNSKETAFVYEPKAELIQSIELRKESNKINVVRSIEEINAYIQLCQQYQLAFIANENAYIWYKDGIIDNLEYANIDDLGILIKEIKPKNEFLLFEDIKTDWIKNLNKKIVVTKTFKQSKKIFYNLKIYDFVM